MSDMPEPLLPWQVCNGGTYWAAKGNTKWSAVCVLKVLRVKAEVERVIPRNGNIIHRKGKVRLDELVKRDPKLKGKDKPTAPPVEIFAHVREVRDQEKDAVPATLEPISEPKPEPPKSGPEEEAVTQARLLSLFDMIDDESTDSDW